MRALTLTGHVVAMAARSLGTFRARSALTALGVTIGVSTVLTIVGVIEGLDTTFRDAISSLGTGTLYVTRTPWIVLGDWWRYAKRPPIVAREAEALAERLTLAEAVVPFVFHRTSVGVGRANLERVRIIGTTAEWPRMSGVAIDEGRFLSAGEVRAGRPVVVVGGDVAAVLAREGLGLGDRLEVAGRPLRVVGTTPARGQIFGQSQDDFLVIPLPLFEAMFGKRRSLQLGVVAAPERLAAAETEIVGTFRGLRRLGPAEESDFSVNQQEMLVDIYRQLTRSLYATALGLALVTLLVAGVGIMNIMLVAVVERTREIGIRKALGARPWSILLQFLAEAAMVSAAGGLAGTVLGLGLVRALGALSPLPASVPGPMALLGLAFGALAGVVFGFLPALRAARLTPVEALAAGG